MTKSALSTKQPSAQLEGQCPVARLAREVAVLARANEAADEANTEELRRLGRRYETSDAEQLLTDRLDGIKELALTLQASSPLGALFQGMIVLHLLDDEMRSEIEQARHGDGDRAMITVDKLHRAVESIVGVLESAAGVDHETIDNGYFCGWGHFRLEEAENFVSRAAASSPAPQ